MSVLLLAKISMDPASRAWCGELRGLAQRCAAVDLERRRALYGENGAARRPQTVLDVSVVSIVSSLSFFRAMESMIEDSHLDRARSFRSSSTSSSHRETLSQTQVSS